MHFSSTDVKGRRGRETGYELGKETEQNNRCEGVVGDFLTAGEIVN